MANATSSCDRHIIRAVQYDGQMNYDVYGLGSSALGTVKSHVPMFAVVLFGWCWHDRLLVAAGTKYSSDNSTKIGVLHTERCRTRAWLLEFSSGSWPIPSRMFRNTSVYQPTALLSTSRPSIIGPVLYYREAGEGSGGIEHLAESSFRCDRRVVELEVRSIRGGRPNARRWQAVVATSEWVRNYE